MKGSSVNGLVNDGCAGRSHSRHAKVSGNETSRPVGATFSTKSLQVPSKGGRLNELCPEVSPDLTHVVCVTATMVSL